MINAIHCDVIQNGQDKSSFDMTTQKLKRYITRECVGLEENRARVDGLELTYVGDETITELGLHKSLHSVSFQLLCVCLVVFSL